MLTDPRNFLSAPVFNILMNEETTFAISSSKLHDLPIEERPRERLWNQGSEVLKTSELLAILMGTGRKGESVMRLAERLLFEFGGLERLSRATPVEISALSGIGPAKAVQISAAFALGGRLKRDARQTQTVSCPEEVCELLGEEMRLLSYESLRVILVNTRNRLIGVHEVSRGLLSETLFHPRETFRPAISAQASGVLLVHNHPSGDCNPSAADHEVTRRFRQAGETLQFRILDHVILGIPSTTYPQGYYSFKESGLI